MESESTPYGSKEPETCLSERGIKTFREFTTGLFFFVCVCLEFVDITMSGSINRREFEKKNLKAMGWRWRKIKREKLFCTRFASLARSEKNNSYKKKINCCGRSELHGSPQHEVLAAVDRQIYLTLGGLIDSP